MDLKARLDEIASASWQQANDKDVAWEAIETIIRRALDEAGLACGLYLCKRETGTDNLEASESYRALRSALGEVKT